jgi:hypothetical protein
MAERATTPLVKKIFNLTVPAYEWLRDEAADLGISTAEFLRRVLDERREKKPKRRARR